jgi:peptidyl-prolyl cis-trans isomerase C
MTGNYLKGTIEALQGRSRVMAGAVVAVALMAGGGWWAVDRLGQLPDDAAFRIGEKVVTQNDLDDRIHVIEALYGVQRPDGGDDADTFQRDAAKSMVVSMLLEEQAKDHDIVISDKAAQDALQKAIDDQALGRAAFVDFLADSGVSENDVLDEIKRQMATARLVEEVTADVEDSTTAQTRAYYEDNRSQMATAEGRRLRNIVVATRSDADRVAREAQSGKPFAQLAALWSRDASTKDKGGDLGVVTAAQLEKDYAEAAFSATPGTVFGPVKTEHGWNIGQVVKVIPGRPLAFEDISKQLEVELKNKALLNSWRSWLADQLKDADVEYANDYKPANPDEAPSELPE